MWLHKAFLLRIHMSYDGRRYLGPESHASGRVCVLFLLGVGADIKAPGQSSVPLCVPSLKLTWTIVKTPDFGFYRGYIGP